MSIQKSASLWQIKSDYQSLLSDLYDHETGEINQEIDLKLCELADSAENKCIAVASWIKQMQSEQSQIEYMKQEILKRESAYQKEIDKRMDYLKTNMTSFGITEVKCPYFTLRIKSNPYSTDIVSEKDIPEKYMKSREVIKMEVKPDKNLIKEDVLKTGIQVPGAYVAQKTKLEILTDKI